MHLCLWCQTCMTVDNMMHHARTGLQWTMASQPTQSLMWHYNLWHYRVLWHYNLWHYITTYRVLWRASTLLVLLVPCTCQPAGLELAESPFLYTR